VFRQTYGLTPKFWLKTVQRPHDHSRMI
jgi:hypothetical protein